MGKTAKTISKGDIVRHIKNGQWIKVACSNRYRLYGQYVPQAKPDDYSEVYISRREVSKPKTITLPASTAVIIRIINKIQKTVSHQETKNWKRLITEDVDLIMLYDATGTWHVYIEPGIVKKTSDGRECRISFDVEKIIAVV